MTERNPEIPSIHEAEIVVEKVNDEQYVAHHAIAADIQYPHVFVDVYDMPHPHYPWTSISTYGVSKCTDLNRFGTSATEGVGKRAKIEIETGPLDEERKLRLATTIAALAFQLSED